MTLAGSRARPSGPQTGTCDQRKKKKQKPKTRAPSNAPRRLADEAITKPPKVNLVKIPTDAMKSLRQHEGALCGPPPPGPAVGRSNMVSLCDAGSRAACVGLLWAAESLKEASVVLPAADGDVGKR